MTSRLPCGSRGEDTPPPSTNEDQAGGGSASGSGSERSWRGGGLGLF